jgi:hypothetical protein
MSMFRRLQITVSLVLIMALGMMGTAIAAPPGDSPQVRGATIQNIVVEGTLTEDSEFGEAGDQVVFTGRMVGVDFTDIQPGNNPEALVEATGRLIGELTNLTQQTTQRINQLFDSLLGLDTGQDGVTQILFLELGPVFLDVLGLIVEIPDPIILEIRAERGPGQLLGNLLVALLGILDG